MKQFDYYIRWKNAQLGYTIVEPLKSRDDTRVPEVRTVGGSKKDDSREKGLKLAR